MDKRTRWLVASVLQLLLLFPINLTGDNSVPVVKLVSELPMALPDGQDISNAVRMAVDDHGGVLAGGAWRIQYVPYDHSHPKRGYPDPEIAIADVKNYGTDDSVVGVVCDPRR